MLPLAVFAQFLDLRRAGFLEAAWRQLHLRIGIGFILEYALTM